MVNWTIVVRAGLNFLCPMRGHCAAYHQVRFLTEFRATMLFAKQCTVQTAMLFVRSVGCCVAYHRVRFSTDSRLLCYVQSVVSSRAAMLEMVYCEDSKIVRSVNSRSIRLPGSHNLMGPGSIGNNRCIE